MTIRKLPQAVVDRIAAGEVVERPASVVKELVENALDAGASRIDVELEGGGTTLIRVADDGHGMGPDDLGMAFESHATSKITDPEELFHVASLGFRGEALSSIASIARARIRSRTPDENAAHEIEAADAARGTVKPAAGSPGTVVEVRDLFFNTPVRRKFLKSTRAENGRVAEWMSRLALSRPDVGFSLTNEGREVFRYPQAGTLLERIGRMFGRDVAANALPVDADRGAMRLGGFVVSPGVDRPNSRLIHLFVNGRFVRDRSWTAALREGYRGLLMRGRYPIAFLMLEVDPAEVDVNVHPTKEEVRFRDPSALFSLTVRGVRQALGRGDLRPDVGGAPGSVRERAAPDGDAGMTGTATASARAVDAPPISRGDDTPSFDFGGASEARSTGDADHATPGASPSASPSPSMTPEGAEADPGPAHVAQLLRTYLFEETPDGGLLVTDQHALHERILFEEIKAKLRAGPLPAQQLLVPERVRVSAREGALLDEARAMLRGFGFRFESAGAEWVSVDAIPALLSKATPEALVRAAIGALDGGGDLDALTDDLIATMACKAAIKAGDALSPRDARTLLAQGEAIRQSPFCPHGRPVTVKLGRAEVERWFRRG